MVVFRVVCELVLIIVWISWLMVGFFRLMWLQLLGLVQLEECQKLYCLLFGELDWEKFEMIMLQFCVCMCLMYCEVFIWCRCILMLICVRLCWNGSSVCFRFLFWSRSLKCSGCLVVFSRCLLMVCQLVLLSRWQVCIRCLWILLLLLFIGGVQVWLKIFLGICLCSGFSKVSLLVLGRL